MRENVGVHLKCFDYRWLTPNNSECLHFICNRIQVVLLAIRHNPLFGHVLCQQLPKKKVPPTLWIWKKRAAREKKISNIFSRELRQIGSRMLIILQYYQIGHSYTTVSLTQVQNVQLNGCLHVISVKNGPNHLFYQTSSRTILLNVQQNFFLLDIQQHNNSLYWTSSRQC